MAQLFKNKTLKAELKNYKVPDFENKLAIVKSWHEAYKNGSLKKKTESQCEQTFNQSFFVEVLGYKSFPSEVYTIEPKGSTESGGQKPDAILGYFSHDTKRVVAVVEIKDVNTPLDKSQQREGNLSPIQQAFKYKPQFKDCSFVIATNFYELRLHKDNQLDFEKFTLDELVSDKDGYFAFKKFYYLLCAENFISKSGKPQTESILAKIRIEEESITKKFYSEYRELRKELIKNVAEHSTKEYSISFPIIVEKAQKIIDRIVFICFCEDLGLLPENKLIEVIEYGQKSPLPPPIWDTMKQFFVAIDSGSDKLGIPDGYNGELFKEDIEINAFKIDDKICRKFADFGKYDFEEDLRVNILGHIFEQSISDIEELKNQQTADESEEISKRKKDGIFYTPEYIVDYIVKNSLGKYLENLEAEIIAKNKLKLDIIDASYEKRSKKAYLEYWEALKAIKVLDPACGSGAFLVRVFDYLLAEHERVGEILGLKKGVADFTGVYKNILQKNIYGVDLNPESVEITKLSLWLKTANKGQKLVTLKDNIKCGNSLIDDPLVAGSSAFNWNEEFKDIMANGGFDVIVGNPPYVSYYSRQSQSDNETKDILTHLIAKFDFIEDKKKLGRFNTMMFFIETAFGKLKPEGFLAFIVDHSIHSNPSMGLRKWLINNYAITNIVNDLDVFDGVASSQVILCCRKISPNNIIQFSKLEDDSNLFTEVKSISQNSINMGEYSLFNPQNELIFSLLNKIECLPTIENILGKSNIRTCITFTGKKECFVRADKEIDIDFPLVEGSNGVPYPYSVVCFNSYIRYDTNLRDTLNEAYKIEAMEGNKRSPKVIGLGDLTKFKSPKIFVRLSDTRLTATFSDEEYCADLSLYIITLPTLKKADSKNDLYYFLGIINSKLLTFFYKKKNWIRNLGTGTPQIRLKDLRSLPIPITDREQQDAMVNLVNSLLEFNSILQAKKEAFLKVLFNEYATASSKKLQSFWELDFDEFVKELKVNNLSLDKKAELLTFFEKNNDEALKLKQQIDALDKEIDDMVFNLYKLTPEEQVIVLQSQSS